MDFDLTERQAFFRDRVRQFIDQPRPPRESRITRRRSTGDRWQPLD